MVCVISHFIFQFSALLVCSVLHTKPGEQQIKDCKNDVVSQRTFSKIGTFIFCCFETKVISKRKKK